MRVEDVPVLNQGEFAAGYYRLDMRVPAIADVARPGQFIHLKIPRLDASVLRRPFSIFGADNGILSILYKPVGGGTRTMLSLQPDEMISVIGPLGNGFPDPSPAAHPLLIGGGYGVAPLYLLARRMPSRTGTVFIGGRSAGDVLCADLFTELGWEVCISTNDGSLGLQGFVTDALDAWIAAHPQQTGTGGECFACGPDGMLKAVGERAITHGMQGWLSLDKHMGCGVGACLACVQRIRQADGHSVLKRVCKDGPIFEAREIIW
jgi:dihydroorotate dehydrogenase electron transfer subunit